MKYSLEIEFDADITEAQAKEWLAAIVDSIPIEMEPHGRVWSPPDVLAVDELTTEHVGRYIHANRGAALKQVDGKLEAVYTSANGTERKTVVVNGIAHELNPYEVITVKNRSND